MTDPPLILYIEDNPDNQWVVQTILEECGYNVVIAEDGPKGIALANALQPLLILVDLNLPGLDGYEIATYLRSMEHLKDSPIVALTADVSPETRERSLAAGCDGYLSKPIDPQQLPEQIAAFVAGKRESVSPAVEIAMLRTHNQKVVGRLEQQVRELMRVNAELQEMDYLKEQFLALISHELRTPLTSLLGYLDLFGRGTLGSLNELQKEAVAVMQRNMDALSRQLNNLLYLQEYRTHPPMFTPVSLISLARHICAKMQAKAIHSGVHLRVQTDEVATIQADPMALELVLMNLLDNAIKFTPPGGQVLLLIREEPARVVIQVEDTGIGIPAEALEKIFLPFYRVDNSLASPQRGSGIGLALVRHLVEAHRGQVMVQSILNQGSIFSIVLPRHPEIRERE